MYQRYFLIILLIAGIGTTYASSNPDCRKYIHSVSALYDIQNLISENYYEYSWGSLESNMIKFNFCREVTGTCGSDHNATAAAFYYDSPGCHKLTRSAIPQMNPLDIHDASAGLILNYTAASSSDQSISYKYSVEIKCHHHQTFTIENVDFHKRASPDSHSNQTVYELKLVAVAKEGCPVRIHHQFFEFMLRFRLIFFIFGGLIGFTQAFWGLKMFRLTLLLSGFQIFFIIISFVLFSYALEGAGITTQLAYGFVAVASGVLGAFVLVRHDRASIFLMSIWFGVVVSFLLYNAIFVHLGFGMVHLYAMMSLFGVVGGLLCFFLWGHLFIISTAITGAYIAIRSLSLIIPRYMFPNEFDLALEVTYNGQAELPWVFYLYFVLISGVAVLGIRYQYNHKRAVVSSKEEDEEIPGSSYSNLSA